MLRNWVTQFGYAPGDRAGDERIPNEERAKYVGQIGNFFGWNPPPGMSWMVEVTKDLKGKHPGKYVVCFFRYATDAEAEKLLGTNYEKYETQKTCTCEKCGCSTNTEVQPVEEVVETQVEEVSPSTSEDTNLI
jgi:hypothetical protein